MESLRNRRSGDAEQGLWDKEQPLWDTGGAMMLSSVAKSKVYARVSALRREHRSIDLVPERLVVPDGLAEENQQPHMQPI